MNGNESNGNGGQSGNVRIGRSINAIGLARELVIGCDASPDFGIGSVVFQGLLDAIEEGQNRNNWRISAGSFVGPDSQTRYQSRLFRTVLVALNGKLSCIIGNLEEKLRVARWDLSNAREDMRQLFQYEVEELEAKVKEWKKKAADEFKLRERAEANVELLEQELHQKDLQLIVAQENGHIVLDYERGSAVEMIAKLRKQLKEEKQNAADETKRREQAEKELEAVKKQRNEAVELVSLLSADAEEAAGLTAADPAQGTVIAAAAAADPQDPVNDAEAVDNMEGTGGVDSGHPFRVVRVMFGSEHEAVTMATDDAADGTDAVDNEAAGDKRKERMIGTPDRNAAKKTDKKKTPSPFSRTRRSTVFNGNYKDVRVTAKGEPLIKPGTTSMGEKPFVFQHPYLQPHKSQNGKDNEDEKKKED